MYYDKKLQREFYLSDTLKIAKNLLGKILVHESINEIYSGYIVEVEAYKGPTDKACHSFNYRHTKRTETMYKIGGTAYVYLIYGMYYCFNVVTCSINVPEAVLIRAIEPLDGINTMTKRRGLKTLNEKDIFKLSSGPGKMTQAMGINKIHNGLDLCSNEIYICESLKKEKLDIVEAKRINVDYADEDKNNLWRFYIKDNPFVSKP